MKLFLFFLSFRLLPKFRLNSLNFFHVLLSKVGTLYVKAFDVIDGIDGANVDVIPECWDQTLNRDKYEIIEQNSSSISEPHVTIAYEQVIHKINVHSKHKIIIIFVI